MLSFLRAAVYGCWRRQGLPMKRQALCPVCGTEFTAGRVTQKYCSSYCRRYAHRHGVNNHETPPPKKPALRTFRCVKCGRLVRVTERTDKRTKFCSSYCERLYWKHSKHVKPSLICRAFHCRTCGTLVEVIDAKDRRTVFCSTECRQRWFSLHRKT